MQEFCQPRKFSLTIVTRKTTLSEEMCATRKIHKDKNDHKLNMYIEHEAIILSSTDTSPYPTPKNRDELQLTVSPMFL